MKNIFTIIGMLTVLGLLVGAGVIGGEKDAVQLSLGTIASQTNGTGASTGTYGYVDTGYCYFTTTGTGVKNVTIQSSATDSAYTNATSAQALTPGDTDSLAFDLRNKAGLYWRVHAEDGSVSAVNTVTAICDLWIN
jgi:hypothetical protein